MTTPAADAGDKANEFDALIADLDTFSKGMMADADAGEGDDNIAAAAADGEAMGDNADGEGGDAASKAGKDGKGDMAGKGDEVLGKSFGVTLEDGTTEEVFDATPLLKSLMADRDTLQAAVAGQGEQLTKALHALQGAVGALKQTGDLVKSLQADVKALRSAGTGRRAVVDVHERQSPAAPAAPVVNGISPNAFMAKALELNKAGEMSSAEIGRLEMIFERGAKPNDDVIRRVMGL